MAALAFLGAFGLVWATPRYWRGEAYLPSQERAPAFWPLNLVLWKGAVRSMPISPAYGLLISVIFGIPAAIGYHEPVTTAWRVYGIVALSCFAVGTTLMISIVLFNRPKGLVPPNMRSQPGAIREWRETRAARKRTGP